MKIKTLVAMLFLSAGATTVVAQDATNCNSNSSISHEAVRAGNFKDAYTPWKAVLENCPTLRFYTFTDGYKILKGLMAQIKDSCLLYTSPSPRDRSVSRMPSSA